MFIPASLLTAALLAYGLVPSSATPTAPRDTSAAALPLNWETAFPCAVDFASRVLANDLTAQFTDNTPAACVARCAAQGYRFAGVEFANECHCGTGFAGGVAPQSAPAGDCDMACTGDGAQTCGGAWSIQIFKSPALVGATILMGCAVDNTTSQALVDPVHHTFADNTDLVNQCIGFCENLGFPFAGVEGGSDCQCSGALQGGAAFVDQAECDSTCPLPTGEIGNEFCGGVDRLMVYEFVG